MIYSTFVVELPENLMKVLKLMKKFIQEVIADFKLSSNKETLKHLMAEGAVAPLIFSLAVCSIFSMLIGAIYNASDTYFVSQLGVSASAAVGIVYSLMAIIDTIGATMGLGAACNISRAIGAGEYDRANFFATTAIFLSFLVTSIIAIVVYLKLEAFLFFIGSTPTILPQAIDYAKYILLAAPFMASCLTMNSILRSEGHATFALVGLLIGGLLNMALDPIFVFVLGWGTKGAAIGTAIGEIVSCGIMLQFILTRKSIVQFSFKSLNIFSRKVLSIFTLGLPTVIRHGLLIASSITANKVTVVYGDSAVAAMSIVGRVVLFFGATIIGLGHGMAPVVGFNYGKKQFRRVLDSYFATMKFGFFVTVVTSSIALIFAPEIIAFFNSDPSVVQIGTFTLRCRTIFILLFPIMCFTNTLIQYMGDAKSASFLASLNHGLLFYPAIFILPHFLGLLGVEMAQAVTNICTIMLYIPFIVHYVRYLKTSEKNSVILMA